MLLRIPFEYVLLHELQGVELVEHLKEHKNVEKHCVQDSILEGVVTLEL